MTGLPTAVLAMGSRGPQWRAWIDALPGLIRSCLDEWKLCLDGDLSHGFCSVVLPVRTEDGAAVLKISYPDSESEHEHVALRRWDGDGVVRLLRADPHRRSMLLERLHRQDLTTLPDVEACKVVAGLYGRIHVPALPQLGALPSRVERWTAKLAAVQRDVPIPRRLAEQAIGLGHSLALEPESATTVIHGDLHYENVLAADREPWLAIDPKPMNGDPHYELAPMLWNRWDEIAADVRRGVRRRFHTLIEAAELDEPRARAWVVVRMIHNAMWELAEGQQADPRWLTMCFAIAKAVQD